MAAQTQMRPAEKAAEQTSSLALETSAPSSGGPSSGSSSPGSLRASRGNQFAQEQMCQAQAKGENDAPRAGAAPPESLFPPMATILATSYADRIAAVEQVGKKHPGIDKGEEVDESLMAQLGIFAGARLQTNWQQESGRGDNIWWSTLNYSLTVIPNKLAAEYASERSSRLRLSRIPKLLSTNIPAAKITEEQVAESWKTYFEVSDRHLTHDHGWSVLGVRFGGDKLPSAQQAYWVAHVLSLKYAEERYKVDLAKKPPPPVEAEFRSAWWAMVELLDDVSFSTKAGFSEFALGLAMPQHLLTDPEAVKKLPLSQEGFVRLLIATRRTALMIQGWLD